MGRVRTTVTGLLARLEASADPAWKAARAWGKSYTRHRCEELTRLHGGELSAGVCALVRQSGNLTADANYLRARASQDGACDLECVRVSAHLLASARQAERDAWELASREAVARRLLQNPADRSLAAALTVTGVQGVADSSQPADGTGRSPRKPPRGSKGRGPKSPRSSLSSAPPFTPPPPLPPELEPK